MKPLVNQPLHQPFLQSANNLDALSCANWFSTSPLMVRISPNVILTSRQSSVSRLNYNVSAISQSIMPRFFCPKYSPKITPSHSIAPLDLMDIDILLTFSWRRLRSSVPLTPNGIELIHPRREGRSKRQIGRKGISKSTMDRRWKTLPAAQPSWTHCELGLRHCQCTWWERLSTPRWWG